ncbi:hypothetical protein [Butyrivibrio sp. AD3002]|uniref:PD-(D/E)XK nuclease domain-containing protein n=1 Tax=Butyrivibrio sp. AD3002 TaxID=1280670 RepID=UPI0003B7165F
MWSAVFFINSYRRNALLRAVFPLARIEEYQDAGACAVRKDICIDEFDIAIELKCTRDSLSAKKLSEEVASLPPTRFAFPAYIS